MDSFLGARSVRPKAKEFFAAYDFRILAAPTKRERSTIENRLKADFQVAQLHKEYEEGFLEQHRAHDALFQWQVAVVGGEKTGGDPDLAKLFLERNAQLLAPGGWTGVVVPSAFHANEGATGIRRLYLEKMALKCCYSFENRRKLFEIHSSFKFALVVTSTGGPTSEFPCAFYLHDDEWIFSEQQAGQALRFTLDFVRLTRGEHLSLLELRSPADLELAELAFQTGHRFGEVAGHLGIHFGRELHMTDDSWRFVPAVDVLASPGDPREPGLRENLLRQGYVVLYEGKSFWHFDDRWGDACRYLVPLASLGSRSEWVSALAHYRALHRKVASATNERTAVFCVVCPGVMSGESCIADARPMARPTSALLFLVSQANSFTFDWCARQLVGANLSGHIRDGLPVPLPTPDRFLSHCALRLTCNHAGYASLWKEQIGDAWRELDKAPFTWPVLTSEEERWEVRSAIDAVVADAYGLSRDQYEHVLHSFDRASGPNPYTEICLEKYDEFKAIGPDAFTKKYDPYWDIPLVESLPKPVIDLPLPNPERSGPQTTMELDAKSDGEDRRRRR